MKLTNSANDICYIDNKIDLQKNDTVCKTIDYKMNQNLKSLPERKIPIIISVKAIVGTPLEIEVSDTTNVVSLIGNIVESAKNQPLTPERIKEQLQKTGQTPFKCENITIDSSPSIFIPIKELNELRRTALDRCV